MKRYLFIFALWFTLAPASTEAQDDLIHSDLPLWGSGDSNVWPQHFFDESSSGCAHNIKLGDWKHEEQYDQQVTDVSWYRLYNYGVIHCFLMVQRGYEQNDLASGDAQYTFLVKLGQFEQEGHSQTLWALQLGGRPGSDYMLLSSSSSQTPLTSFNVLQVECPSGNIRTGPKLDILRTDYCAINSKRVLRKLAQRMAQKPPLAKLSFVASVDEAEESSD